ncbi:hypothetical protein VULLAG_LOCUS7899 [Vulpes lagopus]
MGISLPGNNPGCTSSLINEIFPDIMVFRSFVPMSTLILGNSGVSRPLLWKREHALPVEAIPTSTKGIRGSKKKFNLPTLGAKVCRGGELGRFPEGVQE